MAIMRLDGIDQLKIHDFTENRTYELQAYSTVLQPTSLPRASQAIGYPEVYPEFSDFPGERWLSSSTFDDRFPPDSCVLFLTKIHTTRSTLYNVCSSFSMTTL